MNSPKTLHRKGFTLIEMLVVIAIIAILAGLLFPAITRALESAKRSRAASETRTIASAVELFFDDYSYLPVPKSEQGFPPGTGSIDDYQENNPAYFNQDESRRIIQVLMARETGLPANWQGLNPRQKIYLSGEEIQANGTFLDPWGEQYWIKLDRDYDGKIEFLSQPEQYRARVLVISSGRTRQLFGGPNNRNQRDNIANVQLQW
ncbi:MAG: prepilin-type N-terminal cleavage/methylation domain-containing protein [Verrucomicrobia bacterium]|nr:prepilin-type N-terminal cleavage/methylation domain-containing protein [Verrucomicrobiota bacterium]